MSQENKLGKESAPEGEGEQKPRYKILWPKLSTPEWISAIAASAAAFAAIASVIIAVQTRIVLQGQLDQMSSASQDTKNLVIATQNLAGRAQEQADAMDKLRRAGESQAVAMDKLRIAGEAQAKATENLADAGRTQAAATRNLADNSARQLGAIQASADAAKVQADAVQKQADATVLASKATNRLADAGQAQSKAVLQSLDVARAANDIASRTAIAADRAWVGVQMPVGDTEPNAGQDYKVDINLSNSGRSPAINAMAQVEISLFHFSDKINKLLDKCPEGGCQKMTVFPNGSGFSSTSIVYHPTILAQSMTADEIKKLTSAPPVDLIVIRVRVDYDDTNGNSHMTAACGYFVSKLGFTSCGQQRHNRSMCAQSPHTLGQ